MDQAVYITAAGKFLPGKPVDNLEIEDYLGKIHGQPSRLKRKMLRQNGIQTRYYAINKKQKSLYRNSEMVAKAIQDCLQHAGLENKYIDFLAAATTQGDLPVPGFASMVHGETDLPPCEIASLHGVCGSGMMAIKDAFLRVKTDGKKHALATAGEFASRMLKASRFERQESKQLSLDAEFLRWMLSDGAGALLLQSKPASKQVSLKVEWIDIQSYASRYEVCMYAGANKNREGYLQECWLDYPDFQSADQVGAINLKQDLRLVPHILKLGVDHLFALVDQGKLDGSAIDYLVCHYSSHHFKDQIRELLEKGGLPIPEEKWFTNLYSKGNVGAASLFILLDELLNEQKLKPGQQILCMVPESGRFLTSYMLLTVVGQEAEKEAFVPEEVPYQAPEIHYDTQNKTQAWLVRQLTQVWVDFESRLQKVPIVEKIQRGMLTLEEYKALLFDLRQQVVDGSQWIARAASNISMPYFEIRSSFIRHSSDEHRDYQLLEKNYVSIGGTREELKSGQKNIGSEALSAYMFQRASRPDPFDLLGGMFIIEGLGNRLAGPWGRAIQQQLNLEPHQVSFFTYHEQSDAHGGHFDRFEQAIQSELLTQEIAESIVRTAKVVARLYRMQLEEIA